MTSSPGASSHTPGPTRSTTPATSQPGITGKNVSIASSARPSWSMWSAGLRAAARVRTSTVFCDIFGRSTCSMRRTSGPPNSRYTTARMVAALTPRRPGVRDQFGSDPSNVTAKVDRLLELGLVERLADPGDGRVKLVAATPKGVKLSARLCDNRAWLARVLGDLDSDEVDQVKGALELLLRETDGA